MKKSKHIMNTEKLRAQNRKGNVVLEGDLTIAQAQEIKSKLNDALEKYNNLKVTIRHVTSMDLECIQLLYSFTKTCAEKNKKALLDIHLNPDLQLLLRTCGFSWIINKA